ILGSRVRHTRRSNTSSVGEQGALDTDNGNADNATTNTFTGKCVRENQTDGFRDCRIVRTENYHHTTYVQYRHQWDQSASNSSDRGNTTNNDNSCDNRQNDTNNPTVAGQRAVCPTRCINNLGGNLVGLEDISCTHDGDHHACGKSKA